MCNPRQSGLLQKNPQSLSRNPCQLLSMSKEPSHEDASGTWLKKGIEFQSSGRHSEALESFDHGLLLNPKDADAWNLRGLALAAQNRFEDALESFGKSVSIDQRHPDAWYNKGMVLCALSDTKRRSGLLKRLWRSILRTLMPGTTKAWPYLAWDWTLSPSSPFPARDGSGYTAGTKKNNL